MAAATGMRSRPARGGSRGNAGLDVKALIGFFVLAYAVSWLWAVPLAAVHLVVRQGQGWPTHYLALFGPAIAAVVVTAWTLGRPGVGDLLARMIKWRVALRWWLVALSPVAFLGLALVMMAAVGQALPSPAQFGKFSGIPAIGVAGVLLLILLGALGEETGWRGYALPQLQRRFSPLASSLILAVFWFGWHLPQFFLIPNAATSAQRCFRQGTTPTGSLALRRRTPSCGPPRSLPGPAVLASQAGRGPGGYVRYESCRLQAMRYQTTLN
jgi:membrane protease YdiL (CAAX protease family)